MKKKNRIAPVIFPHSALPTTRGLSNLRFVSGGKTATRSDYLLKRFPS